MNKKVIGFLENLVMGAIFLVLIQTFLDDFSVAAGWTWNARKVLIVTGFFFDFFFTVEFLIRLYSSLAQRKGIHYLLQERGWIDFIASVPLLLFNSLPLFLGLVAGGSGLVIGGMLNMVKIVKAVRIARVLRLLRVLKVFKKIKYADSRMAQQHSTKAITISVAGFLLPFFILTLTLSSFGLNFRQQDSDKRQADFVDLALLNTDCIDDLMEDMGDLVDEVLLIKVDGRTEFSRFDQSYYDSRFASSDYDYLEKGSVEVFFDLRTENRDDAMSNLILFGTILFVVLFFLLLYSTQFAMYVSDPIIVMLKGMTDPGYNLEVKIPQDREEEEIFQLAHSYNEEYLPVKAQKADEEGVQTGLKLEDMGDLFSLEIEAPPSGDDEEGV